MPDPVEQTDAVEVREAAERFLRVWDEFDGPPLTVEETHQAVAEHVEGLRTALDRVPSQSSERREKLSEVWTIYVCPECANSVLPGPTVGPAKIGDEVWGPVCWHCWHYPNAKAKRYKTRPVSMESIEVVPCSLSGLASILQGLDEEALVKRLSEAIGGALLDVGLASSDYAIDNAAAWNERVEQVTKAVLSELEGPDG